MVSCTEKSSQFDTTPKTPVFTDKNHLATKIFPARTTKSTKKVANCSKFSAKCVLEVERKVGKNQYKYQPSTKKFGQAGWKLTLSVWFSLGLGDRSNPKPNERRPK